MNIKKNISDKIKNNKRLYILIQSVRYLKKKEFRDYLEAYFDPDINTILVNGKLKPGTEIYYLIDWGNTNECFIGGFWAIVRKTMRCLYFAEIMNLKPVILWGHGVEYFDKDMRPEESNVFEYYYQPINLKYEELRSGDFGIINRRDSDSTHGPDKSMKISSYSITEREIEVFGYLYKKYFKLNREMTDYINNEITKLFKKSDMVLGIHIRGTDFKKGKKGHPIFCGFDIYINTIKDIMKTAKYEKLFLATDDKEAIDKFRTAFGDKVLFFEDCARSYDKEVSIYKTNISSPYLFGRDVIRDVYALASCKSLVCGLSMVSFAAQYVKKSFGESFDHIHKIEMQINL